MHLGCIAGLDESEGGALWGFYGFGMSLPGGIDFWSLCYCMHCVLWFCRAMFLVPMLGWDALSTCPLHIRCIVSVPGVGGAMCLLVTPTYVVSVFTQAIQSYPADCVCTATF